MRLATDEDAPAMLDVLRDAFGEWPAVPLRGSRLDHLRWKLESTEMQAVLFVGDELVAVSASWHHQLKLGAATVPVYNGVDFGVATRFQGQGLGRRIDEIWASDEPQNYLSIDTVSRSAPVQHLYPIVGPLIPMTVWMLPLSPTEAIRSAAGREGLRALAARLPRRFGGGRSRAGVEIRNVTRFDERADELWAQVASSFDVVAERTAERLNWRFIDPRAGEIVVLGAFGGDSLLGYVALRAAGSDGTSRMLDLFAPVDQPQVVTSLLAGAAGAARRTGARRLEAWLPAGHAYGRQLEVAGFIETDADQQVHFDTARLERTPEAAAVLTEPGVAIHLTLGDFDWA